jgi:hypothetical protein
VLSTLSFHNQLVFTYVSGLSAGIGVLLDAMTASEWDRLVAFPAGICFAYNILILMEELIRSQEFTPLGFRCNWSVIRMHSYEWLELSTILQGVVIVPNAEAVFPRAQRPSG